MAAKVLQHPVFGVQKCACKAVAAAFFVFFAHVSWQCHDPVPQFVRRSEADSLTRSVAIEANQDMLVVMGGCASTVKVIRAVQQSHLDAVVLQQFGQVGNGIVANLQLLPQLLGGAFCLFRVGNRQ